MSSPIIIPVGNTNEEARKSLVNCAKTVPGVSDAWVVERELRVVASAGVIGADVMAAFTREGLHWITNSVDPE